MESVVTDPAAGRCWGQRLRRRGPAAREGRTGPSAAVSRHLPSLSLAHTRACACAHTHREVKEKMHSRREEIRLKKCFRLQYDHLPGKPHRIN